MKTLKKIKLKDTPVIKTTGEDGSGSESGSTGSDTGSTKPPVPR
jgi:hypothetical protein